jgi:hypothetical protein
MATFPPPTTYFNGILYNPSFFNSATGSYVTTTYATTNYFRRSGTATSIASSSTFTGLIILQNTGESTSYLTGSITTAGGLGVAKNIYTNGTIFDSPQATYNILPSVPTIITGATTGTYTIRNATLSLPNATSLTCSSALANIFTTNVITTNLLTACSNLSIGASTGSLSFNNTTINMQNCTKLQICNSVDMIIGYQTKSSGNNHNIGIGQLVFGGAGGLTTLNSTAVGFAACYALTSGSYNSAYGYYSMNSQNTFPITGSTNSAFGVFSLQFLNSGSSNCAFGANALLGSAGAPLTGSWNCAFGANSGTAIQGAGNSNACFGQGSGSLITTGSNNICIGTNSGTASSFTTLTTQSNNVVIGNNGITNYYLSGASSCSIDCNTSFLSLFLYPGSIQLGIPGSLLTTGIQANNCPITTIVPGFSGVTVANVYWFQDNRGSYKRITIQLNGATCANTTITFNTAFSYLPRVSASNSGSGGILAGISTVCSTLQGVTLNTTSFTFNCTTQVGVVIIEGY